MGMAREAHVAARRSGYFPRVAVATIVVTVLPGVVAAALQAFGLIHGWLPSAAVAVVLSMALAAIGSVWWTRRPASRDIVFADLMLWGWLRRVWTERRLACARRLLGDTGLDPARKAALLERLSGALESRDLYTHGHSRRVTRHSYRIARQMGLPAAEAACIRTAAALHDVGKIETPREVLNKPERLTDEEFRLIQRHPVDGARMVEALGDEELTSIVRHHHERLDGGGYPDGLVGGAIPLGARVIAVADTFDALTSNRPYRQGCRHKKALDILRAEAGTQLDPDVVAAFLSYYSGRRVLPWWSAVAEAPGRLAAWALSGLQGATAAPLGGGAASLGAAFLVGASLAGTPATGEAARSVNASADVAPAAAGGGSGPGSETPSGGGETGAGGDGSSDQGGDGSRRSQDGGRPEGERLLRSAPAKAGEQPRQSHGGTAPGGSGGGAPGGGEVAGERALELPRVATPRLATKPADADGDDDSDRPARVDVPDVDVDDDGSDDRPKLETPRIEVDTPNLKVEVPEVKVDLPKVEVPPVEVEVELPPVEVPKVLPKVQLPKVEVKLPRLRLP
jgi:putative nucleotidyltransferase with HDIG domain